MPTPAKLVTSQCTHAPTAFRYPRNYFYRILTSNFNNFIMLHTVISSMHLHNCHTHHKNDNSPCTSLLITKNENIF